ncbi:MAG TPA: hypothetical protein EYP78_01575 [Candidatus Omnitrophica bacterium]|nr:hypothetical protein [Candidatus Omnitrophota bacterium]
MESSKFAVVLEKVAGNDFLLISKIVAQTLKIPRFEASKVVSKSPGIPAEGLGKVEATALSGMLRENGIGSFVLSVEKMVKVPPPIQVRSAQITEGEIYFEKGIVIKKKEGWLVPWRNIVVLCCARVKIQSEEKVIKHPPLGKYLSSGDIVVNISGFRGPKVEIKTKTAWKNFFDIISVEPYNHFRIIGEEFNLLALGLTQPTVFESLVALIRNISSRCDIAYKDGSIHDILDGDPLTNVRFASPEIYDNYIRWVLQVAFCRER